jgi:thiol-disulfide isomerase/thioredoxin
MKRRQVLSLPLSVPLTAPLTLASSPAAWAAAARPGEPVAWPDVTLLDGTRLTGASLQGRAVVVVFWSTTCPFCRRHNQHVDKLHRAAQGLPLTVLGVARERDAAVVRRYVQQQGYGFAITLDHAPLAAALSERKMIPLTAVVDRQGRLKQVLPGEMFEEDVMELLQLAQGGARS